MRSNGTITDPGIYGLDPVTAIKDNGQIVVGGSNALGQEHVLLFTQLAPGICRPPRLIHAGGSGRLRGARDCSHHPAERTDTGGGPP